MEADEISLEVDLVAGTAKIVAPKEAFPDAAREAREILALRGGWNKAPDPTPSAPPSSTAPPPSEAPQRKASRTPGASSGRPGRIGSFEPVNFNFTEEQERTIHGFYQQKRPSTNNEKVAVAICAGEKVSEQRVYDYNAIYSLMRLGAEKDLPKALDVVMSAMKKENWVSAEAGGFSLKFLARDHVERNLPASTT